jgi:Zn-dependent protease with chaperone function
VLVARLFGQQADPRLENYYSLPMESELGDKFVKQLQANITSAPDPRLDKIVQRLSTLSSQYQFRIFVFDGGTPSPDEAPAAAFPANWRQLNIGEAIAAAGGSIFVPRVLLTQSDEQLAAIVAHAMAHIELRHATIGLTRGEQAQVEVQAASRAPAEEASALVQAITDKRLAFDRACELAADEYAVKILRAAAIDPAPLVKYVQSLPPATRQESSVYPSPSERIHAVQAAIANLAR